MSSPSPATGPAPGGEPHRARQMAESFGVDAARYDRARPRYPDTLIDRIVAASPGRDVLDVGCGTGIAARQLLAAGCTVLGVEPDARMAEFARQQGLEVEVTTFEEWRPAGRAFDAVVAGQAWHWVDPVAGAARAAEALRPGGLFAAFWNGGDPPDDLAEAIGAVLRRVMPGSFAARAGSRRLSGDAYGPMCDRAADGMRQAGGFGAPERWRFDWERTYDRDEWLELLPTQGALTQAPPEQLAELLDGIAAAIDTAGGSFPVRYTTLAITAVRSATTSSMATFATSAPEG